MLELDVKPFINKRRSGRCLEWKEEWELFLEVFVLLLSGKAMT